MKVSGGGINIVKKLDGIYFDQMHDLIEEYTGLYVSLYPRKN